MIFWEIKILIFQNRMAPPMNTQDVPSIPPLGPIEIQTTQKDGIKVPLGLVNSIRTSSDQSVVINPVSGFVTLENDQNNSSLASSSILESSILPTNIAGIDLVS